MDVSSVSLYVVLGLTAFFLALLPCCLLAYPLSPSATVLNQIVCVAGWGFAMVWGSTRQGRLRLPMVVLLPTLVYGSAALFAWAVQDVPASIAVSTATTLAAATAVLTLGAQGASDKVDTMQRAFMVAMVVLGVFNVVISLVQVFWPALADGDFIARSGLPGRAVGNLRQPNHLSTLAVWSAVAVIPLIERERVPRWLGAGFFAAFVFLVELSASRTGMLGVLLLAAWGIVDARLSRFSRWLLAAGLFVYAVGWGGMTVWADESHQVFGAAARLAEKDVSGSRYGIWANTLFLIRTHWLSGIGLGEFNFVWTLTTFPSRPVAFFDHTHNLALELLVELGVPLGGALLAMLLAALGVAAVRAWRVCGPTGIWARAAFVMLLLALVHSQFEYPLWYAYFLLPTAWVWGYCAAPRKASAVGRRANVAALESAGLLQKAWLSVGGALMLLGSVWAYDQYKTVSEIFSPDSSDTRSLPERIRAGQRTLFYAHHADYAAATVAEHPSATWDAFRTAPHYLLDTRLMIAWANGFAERGDVDHARYIAERLREFHKDDAQAYFAACTRPPVLKPLPYQCAPPARPVDWHEFKSPVLWKRAPFVSAAR